MKNHFKNRDLTGDTGQGNLKSKRGKKLARKTKDREIETEACSLVLFWRSLDGALSFHRPASRTFLRIFPLSASMDVEVKNSHCFQSVPKLRTTPEAEPLSVCVY